MQEDEDDGDASAWMRNDATNRITITMEVLVFVLFQVSVVMINHMLVCACVACAAGSVPVCTRCELGLLLWAFNGHSLPAFSFIP